MSDEYELKPVYAKDIIETLPKLNNESRPKLIIFPGGGDIPYQKKLKGIGCENIRKYVANGGNYLGFCAGGYFGCNEIHFQFGAKSWSAKRELSFDNNLKCSGPILASYDAATQQGIKASKIKLDDGQILNVYYNGGGHFYFTDPESMKQWNILATYELDNDEMRSYVIQHLQNKELYKCDERNHHITHDISSLIAMIHGKFGKGNVILTGIHPEIDWGLLDNEDPYLNKIIIALKEENNHQKRLKLLTRMLNIFEINTRNISKL